MLSVMSIVKMNLHLHNGDKKRDLKCVLSRKEYVKEIEGQACGFLLPLLKSTKLPLLCAQVMLVFRRIKCIYGYVKYSMCVYANVQFVHVFSVVLQTIFSIVLPCLSASG